MGENKGRKEEEKQRGKTWEGKEGSGRINPEKVSTITPTETKGRKEMYIQ